MDDISFFFRNVVFIDVWCKLHGIGKNQERQTFVGLAEEILPADSSAISLMIKCLA